MRKFGAQCIYSNITFRTIYNLKAIHERWRCESYYQPDSKPPQIHISAFRSEPKTIFSDIFHRFNICPRRFVLFHKNNDTSKADAGKEQSRKLRNIVMWG